MKSVIQEASSLTRAIEQGWLKAGKPTLFSVKIIQEPSKNFIGMTTQTAKVVVFFGRFDTPIPEQPQPQPPSEGSKKQTAPKIQQRPLKPQYQTNQQPQQAQQQRSSRKNYRRYRPQRSTQQQQQQQEKPTSQQPEVPKSQS